MRRYFVHLDRRLVVDGPLHWAVSSHDEDLIEVATYEEAVGLACKLADADAALSRETTEVIVEACREHGARRILFSGEGESDRGAVGTIGLTGRPEFS